MSPGGLTCNSTPRPEDQFPTSWKMWLLQPTVRLGKASRPETMSVCWSIYLHLHLSQTIYLSICLPFSTIPPSHSASASFCSSESVSKIPSHIFFSSLIQPPQYCSCCCMQTFLRSAGLFREFSILLSQWHVGLSLQQPCFPQDGIIIECLQLVSSEAVF